MNTTQAQIITASQSITNIENQLNSIQTQASNFAANSKIQDIEKELQNIRLANAHDPKSVSLQQDAKDLQLALPNTTKSFNRPKITDVTTIGLPAKPQYELAPKVEKLKDLHNSSMALTFTSDTISNITHMHVRIRQAIDTGCSTSSLLTDIKHCTEVPDFFDELVPKPSHQFYFSILGSYKTISNARLTRFLQPETVAASASKTEQTI